VFVNQSQLRHVLRPDQYFSADQHRVELERLFLPAWHCVTTTAELPRHGDFLTLDLLGRPLLVRNVDGEVHAFLNVCAHRHCTLTSEARGRDPRFRCQYHGWEYASDGRTARIPDAGCFRPWDREHARLHKFRLERRGELVFVSLADSGPSLAEYLGPFDGPCAEWFGPPYRLAWAWQTDYAANWKVVVENSLESYHIPCVHRKTFGEMPPEETSEHDLTERWTTFRTPEPDNSVSRNQRWVVRQLGMTPTSVYTHHHSHPHLTFNSLDVHRMAQLVVPTGPTTSRHLVWLYTLRGTRTNPFARLLGAAMARLVTSVARKIVLEDAQLFARVQRGLEASVHPGVIGTREERVYAFQEYVARECGPSPR
jgi:phenylpropionate dioxygenase-like ring-hydroxylating dioxygenase large terminal subunit